MIKQNESELASTVFKIQPHKANSFFWFLLFLQSFNCLYLWNQLSNLYRQYFHQIKAYNNNTLIENAQKLKFVYFGFRLILVFTYACIFYIILPIIDEVKGVLHPWT